MEINIWILLSILTIHWFADFVVQTPYQAENKSKSWEPLLGHTGFYSLIWMAPAIGLFYFANTTQTGEWYGGRAVLFSIITFVCHTATDYYTSRVNSALWEKKEVHNFFVSVGFDQLLHYIQLILTFYYLSKS